MEKASRPLKMLVLGGTGFLGPHVVRHALARGHEVTLLNRGKSQPHLFPELEKLRGDRRLPGGEGLAALGGSRRWDAVIDTWPVMPRLVRESTALLRERAEHYLFVATVNVYDGAPPPGADEEDRKAVTTVETEEFSPEIYGAYKWRCEQIVAEAFAGRSASLRPCLIIGPGDPTDRFTYWPLRMERAAKEAAARHVLAPHAADEPVQLIDARDLAAFAVRCAETRAVGAFNALGDVMPAGEMLAACARAAGATPDLAWVPWEFLKSQGVQPWQELTAWVPDVEPEFKNFHRRSNARAKAAGLAFRPLEEAARDTLAWFASLPEPRRAAPRAGLAPEKEAAVLAAWKAQAAGAGAEGAGTPRT